MKCYLTGINILINSIIKIYDYINTLPQMKTYNNLVGVMAGWSQGNALEIQQAMQDNTAPQHFIDIWGVNLAQIISQEFYHNIIFLENTQNWNANFNVLIAQHTDQWCTAYAWLPYITMTSVTFDVFENCITNDSGYSFFSPYNTTGLFGDKSVRIEGEGAVCAAAAIVVGVLTELDIIGIYSIEKANNITEYHKADAIEVESRQVNYQTQEDDLQNHDDSDMNEVILEDNLQCANNFDHYFEQEICLAI
ncbi:MAG: hypothetical protein ACI8ZF_001021 [Candidatus Midichloriaceae bacterium]|jgi:hypothetical protein